MVTRRSFLLALGAGLVGTGGVVYWQLPGETIATGYPDIRYGEENCARCRMVISSVKYACAWRQANGDEEHFDDIGCMVLLNGERHMSVDTVYWVHDFDSEGWLDAQSASYVRSPHLHSPMSYGIAASLDFDASDALHAETDMQNILSWNALQLVMKDAE